MLRGLTLRQHERCSNVCVCVSCHWGHCHEKPLDNSHDKQKYFAKPQSLDAAAEEPSGHGADEDPVLSVENAGRDSDALRLESKLIWPKLCFCGKINSWTLGFHFSLLSRVCFLLATSTQHRVNIRSGGWALNWGRRHCSEGVLFTLFSAPVVSLWSERLLKGDSLWLLDYIALTPGLSSDALLLSPLLCREDACILTLLFSPSLILCYLALGVSLVNKAVTPRLFLSSGICTAPASGSLSWCIGALSLTSLLSSLRLLLLCFLKCVIPVAVTAAQLTQGPVYFPSLRPVAALISASALSAGNCLRLSSLLSLNLFSNNCSLLLCIYNYLCVSYIQAYLES